MPPSMQIFSPVMKPAMSEQRYITMFAMSMGFPTRPAGCCRASGPSYTWYAVSIHPGEMEFTRTFPAKLAARAWVSAAIPPFAAV